MVPALFCYSGKRRSARATTEDVLLSVLRAILLGWKTISWHPRVKSTTLITRALARQKYRQEGISVKNLIYIPLATIRPTDYKKSRQV